MRRIILFGLAVVCLATTAQAQGLKEKKKGQKALEMGDLRTAITELESALIGLPEDGEVHLWLAECYLEYGNGQKAIGHARKAQKYLKGRDAEVNYALAWSYHLTHDFARAKEHYIKSDPGRTNHRHISKMTAECDQGIRLMKSPVNVKITNMGDLVNSSDHDVLPKITADRSRLYFTSQRPGMIGGPENPEDIYVSENKGGAWQKPKNVGAPISTDNNDAIVGLSADGQTMFIFRGDNQGDIYQSTLKGDRWTTPQPIKAVNTAMKESSVCLSADERTLFFVRDLGGNKDIFFCSRSSTGGWSGARRVPGINTPYDEESPYLHPDGKTLYFSSNGPGTMGGYDIFKSTLQPTGYWSTPENLGYPINTAGDELCFVLSADGTLGYYASEKEGGFGRQDLYTIRFLDAEKPEMALVKGKVTESLTGEAIEADISITDNKTGEEVARLRSNGTTGEYLVSLPSGKDYGLRIEREGHLFHSENITLEKGKDYVELRKDVKLLKAEKGSKIVLRNVFFDSGSDALRNESRAELDDLVAILKQYPKLRVQIAGHTDNIGDAGANLSLSEKRAKSVVAYLVGKGIPAARLEAVGYGETQPIAPNSSEDGRQQNRRTEFEILE